jgi:hypothetical protein
MRVRIWICIGNILYAGTMIFFYFHENFGESHCSESRVETKTPVFIFAKSENKKKFAHFSRNFVSRKFSFSRKIVVPGMFFAKNFRFCENFQPVFQIWIHIQVAPESGSAFQMENFRKKISRTGKFSRKHSRKQKFSRKLSWKLKFS